jgi:DNA ligase (NAD+)
MDKVLEEIKKFSYIDFKTYIKSKSLKELVTLREYLDDLYYNSDTTILSDSKYDLLKDELIKKDPLQKVKVGAPLRDDDNRVKLPYWLGSMDKIYPDDASDYTKWILENRADKYFVSEKLDGVSCMIIYNKGKISLYTRGDGTYGADISYLEQYIKNIPSINEKIAIRGELIMSKDDFTTHFAKKYKNARNLVSGVVNSKKLSEAANYVQFIAYEIIEDMCVSISEQFERLEELGFKTAKHVLTSDISIPTLEGILIEWKNSSQFDVDGIIVQKDTEYYRNKSGNPNYAFAFKMVLDDAILETNVLGVEWNLSKRGQLKPRVKVTPVNISGVTINFATGFNAKFIEDNKVGPGTIIKVTRAGEVIPYIVEVVKGTYADMPRIGYSWNATRVDIIATDDKDAGDVCIKLLTYFFQVLDIKYVNDATIKKLYDNGFNTLLKIVAAKKGAFSHIDGLGEKSGNRIIENIAEGLKNVTIVKLMTASGIFGFGIGEKKLKKLIIKKPDIFKLYYTYGEEYTKNEITQVEGFSDITASKISNNIPYFVMFYKAIKPYITLKQQQKRVQNRFKDMKIVFTGFRDNTLQELIESEGGSVTTSVSKKTTLIIASDPNETTGKVKKAKELGIKIYSKEQFANAYLKDDKKEDEQKDKKVKKTPIGKENTITQLFGASPKSSPKPPSKKTVKLEDDIVLVIGNVKEDLPLAIFDFDHTMVKPKNKRQFPKDKDDWEWTSDKVESKIKEYNTKGYQVVIVTDQSKDWKIDMIMEVVNILNIPVIIIIGVKKESKKPNPNLFQNNIKNVIPSSFYVGDAAGRRGDWSDCDKIFAANIKVDFFTPEEFFK